MIVGRGIIMKKILSISIAALITLGVSNSYIKQVNSAESSPKVVYTDTWTTSCFIDDDTETLYPYIKCTSKVFNDDGAKIYLFGSSNNSNSYPKHITVVKSPLKENHLDLGTPIQKRLIEIENLLTFTGFLFICPLLFLSL